MKQFHAAVFISTFLLTLTDCQATDPRDTTTSQGNIMFLEFTRRSVQVFRRSFVVGTIRVEDEGFRFIPALNSPRGFMTQEKFERVFWYNPLFKELYIPFGNLSSINHNGRITTNDKKMYMISSHDHESWDRIYNQIKQAAPSSADKRGKPYDKFVEVLSFPKSAHILELYRRGSMHVLHKTMSRGELKMEEDGLRFIPMTEIPPGYSSQELFERVYWYNLLMREVYIPYSEIKSVRQKVYFRTKDGHKYALMGGNFKKWKGTVREIEAKISE